jgi:hypothetical protein
MTRWIPLPADIEPQVRNLIIRLRERTDQAGITTTALAHRTAYSRSSWTRWLNGRTVPPRNVVEKFGQLTGLDGVDTARLLALWELADGVPTRTDHGPSRDTGPSARRPVDAGPAVLSQRPALLMAATVAAVVAVIVVGALWTVDDRSPSAPLRVAATTIGYSCGHRDHGDRWYAGHSTATTTVVAPGAHGQDVIEVQCLLEQHGVDPGRIDGLFGPRTEQAVQRLQSTAGLVADGVVGSRTWAVLPG